MRNEVVEGGEEGRHPFGRTMEEENPPLPLSLLPESDRRHESSGKAAPRSALATSGEAVRLVHATGHTNPWFLFYFFIEDLPNPNPQSPLFITGWWPVQSSYWTPKARY